MWLGIWLSVLICIFLSGCGVCVGRGGSASAPFIACGLGIRVQAPGSVGAELACPAPVHNPSRRHYR